MQLMTCIVYGTATDDAMVVCRNPAQQYGRPENDFLYTVHVSLQRFK